MDQQTLHKLQSIRQYPSISILLPTNRTSPANQQDIIKLKNLAKQAEERLYQEFSKREIEDILVRLYKLIDSINVNQNQDGLAIYVNAHYAEKFDIPFSVKERVIIDHTFATRDLIMTINRSSRYYVMAISGKEIRLFDAFSDRLREIHENGFPHIFSTDGSANLERHVNSDKDNLVKEFFNQADKQFLQLYYQNPRGLVLMGAGKSLSHYRDIADNKKVIIAEIDGNYDSKTPHEIGAIVWPQVKDILAEERNKILEELQIAVSAQKYVSGIGEVWRLANQARGRILLVEEDYRPAGITTPDGQNIELVEDSTKPGVIDDLVDEIAETVMLAGGSVAFVEPGKLSDHQKIALILRY